MVTRQELDKVDKAPEKRGALNAGKEQAFSKLPQGLLSVSTLPLQTRLQTRQQMMSSEPGSGQKLR